MLNLQRSKTEPISSQEQLQLTGRVRSSSEPRSSRMRQISNELSVTMATIGRNDASVRNDTTPQRQIVSDSFPSLEMITTMQMRVKSMQRCDYRPESRNELHPDGRSTDAQVQRNKTFGASNPATADDTTAHDSLNTDFSTHHSVMPHSSDQVSSMAVERGRPRHRTKPSARQNHCNRTSCARGSRSSVCSVGDELMRDSEDLTSPDRQHEQRLSDSATLAGVGAWAGCDQVDSDA